MYGGGSIKTAFGGMLQQYTLPLGPEVNTLDPLIYLNEQKDSIKDTLTSSVIKDRQV